MLLLATFLYCVGSALVPVLNAEVYVAAAAASDLPTALVALVAAAGQMVGKVAWYYAGAGGTRIPRIQRTMAQPYWQARMETWHHRTHGRPVWTTALFFVSALTGFPPFAVLSVVAGVLRIPLWIFFVAGSAGRFLRFWAVIGGAGALLAWWPW